MAVIFTVFSLTGCDSDTGSKSGYGTIKINNASAYAKIEGVMIDDAATDKTVLQERVDIPAKNGTKSFSISPGKYIVYIYDDGGHYANSYQITIDAGQTVTLTYNGTDLF